MTSNKTYFIFDGINMDYDDFVYSRASAASDAIGSEPLTSATLEYIIDMLWPKSPPVPQAIVDRVFNALAWLELDMPATEHDVRAARKRLARKYHPDVGGDAETMKQINASADLLLEMTE